MEPVSREMAIAILKKGLPGKNVEKLDAMREVSEVVHDFGSAGVLFQNNIEYSQRNRIMNSPPRENIDFKEVVKFPQTAVNSIHANTQEIDVDSVITEEMI